MNAAGTVPRMTHQTNLPSSPPQRAAAICREGFPGDVAEGVGGYDKRSNGQRIIRGALGRCKAESNPPATGNKNGIDFRCARDYVCE